MNKKISLFITALLFIITGAAQRDAGIKPLLSPAGELQLPLQTTTITQKLKVQPVVTIDTVIMEEPHEWITSSGLSLLSLPGDKNSCRAVSLTSSKGQPLKGLPYGLVLLGTTLQNCETRFKTGIRKKEKLYNTDNPDQLSGHSLLIKKGKYYLALLLDQQNRLEKITISLYDPETAG